MLRIFLINEWIIKQVGLTSGAEKGLCHCVLKAVCLSLPVVSDPESIASQADSAKMTLPRHGDVFPSIRLYATYRTLLDAKVCSPDERDILFACTKASSQCFT